MAYADLSVCKGLDLDMQLLLLLLLLSCLAPNLARGVSYERWSSLGFRFSLDVAGIRAGTGATDAIGAIRASMDDPTPE